MSIRKNIFILLTIIGIIPSASRTMANESLEQVTLQLKYFHQFQFAGYYAAIEKGFYAEEGLDVKLLEWNAGEDYIPNVLNGPARYGVSDSGLLLNRLSGQPVVLLAQIIQNSPMVFLTLKESGLKRAYDLAGKSIMMNINYNINPALNGLLIKALGGVDKVYRLPESHRNEDLADHKVDAIGAYITNEPFWFKKRGIDINIIDPVDYGINLYGDNLFTSEDEISNYPERVEKMIRASIKGWQYALEHKSEIVDLI